MFFCYRYLLLFFLLSVFSCTPSPPPETNDCGITFFDIAMRENYLFKGFILACHYPDPKDLVLHEQEAEVNFLSYEDDSLRFRLVTESVLLTRDTIFTYTASCYEGDDDPNSPDDELFIWIYNDIDTIGNFRRSLSKFTFYFDLNIFDNDCFPFGTDIYFRGTLID